MGDSCADVRLKTPANFYICGPSQCRKSHLVRNILLNSTDLFINVPKWILYIADVRQREFEQLTKTIPGINIVVGFPYNIYDMFEGYKSSLVILDDLRQNIRMTNVYQIYLHAVHIIKISLS